MGRKIAHPVFAALFDRMSQSAERQLIGPWRDELLQGCQGVVLDLGAGTGANFPYLLPLVEQGKVTEIVAVEPDPHMLRRARQRAEKLRLKVTFIEATAEDLPLQDHTVDHVLSTFVLCTVHDSAASIREIYRVLKEKGDVRFMEHVRDADRHGRWQDRLTPLWRFFAGGCSLNRTTGELLKIQFDELNYAERTAPFPVAKVLLGKAVKNSESYGQRDGRG